VFQPTEQEKQQRNQVIQSLLSCIKDSQPILLPRYDEQKKIAHRLSSGLDISLLVDNSFGGKVQGYFYQIEGEEDLLHLIISKGSAEEITPKESKIVVEFLLKGVPAGLVWIKPGHQSQHFYFGHDDLERYVQQVA
jgi:hypothetical protein